MFKINGSFYHFNYESSKKNKYYLCIKRRRGIKCRGSITISPNSKIIKKAKHSCNPSKNKNSPPRMLKNKETRHFQPMIKTINGYNYNFQTQYKNKNKHFSCEKSKSERCRGYVTLSPNETIVRKRFHTCSGICKIEDNNCT